MRWTALGCCLVLAAGCSGVPSGGGDTSGPGTPTGSPDDPSTSGGASAGAGDPTSGAGDPAGPTAPAPPATGRKSGIVDVRLVDAPNPDVKKVVVTIDHVDVEIEGV